MGKVIVEARVENSGDRWMANQGAMAAESVRAIEVSDALVDTGATRLSLPPALIASLGLQKVSEKSVKTTAGPTQASVYSPVNLTVRGRTCVVEVMGLPEGVPALIGYVPLELLDFQIDPKSQKLIGNPAHGGEQMYNFY